MANEQRGLKLLLCPNFKKKIKVRVTIFEPNEMVRVAKGKARELSLVERERVPAAEGHSAQPLPTPASLSFLFLISLLSSPNQAPGRGQKGQWNSHQRPPDTW